MLVILKIPVIYLAVVVLWAVRAEPEAAGGSDAVGVLTPPEPCSWSDWQRRRGIVRPRRGPARPGGTRAAGRVRVS
jgi:hypothetical protein